MYTVRHARANFKKMLDNAKYHPVAITRNGKTYLLVCKDSAYMAKKRVVDEEAYTPSTAYPAKSLATVRVKPSRNKFVVHDEITDLQAQMKEELEFCQDADSSREVTRKYKQRIDALWTEYRELA